MSNFLNFMVEYETALTTLVIKNPTEYAYPVAQVPLVVNKMSKAFLAGATGKGPWPNKGPAMARACRAIGIKPTFKALGEYIRKDLGDEDKDQLRAELNASTR